MLAVCLSIVREVNLSFSHCSLFLTCRIVEISSLSVTSNIRGRAPADTRPCEGASVNLWDRLNGSPHPLGCTWIADENAYNFALYSKHATKVTLLFYSEGNPRTPVHAYEFDDRKNRSARIWHCRIAASDLGEALHYAYRIDGPPCAAGYEWHQFDPDKILVDPYAQSIFFPPEFDREAACRSGRNDGKAPLGRLTEHGDEFHWGKDAPVRHDYDLVIYEMHVKGFTANPNSGVAEERRGKFTGVIDKIPYLVDLGVTAVELMPVHQFDPTDGNYWGYMTLNYFSPHNQFDNSPNFGGQKNEFREMVKALHAAGIEVILDVVYNHTCEGDHAGPRFSFKGIDNSSYYMINRDNPQEPYANYSGTGNTMHAANPIVRRLVLDSLRYWVEVMHVDGFRFDLASILTRNTDGSFNQEDPPLFSQIAADPVLNTVRLIAEEWDFDIYNNLRFPGQAWWLWNARFRDGAQSYLRGDAGIVSEMMSRLYGSSDMFPDTLPDSYRPSQSVNYVVSHDGFTLYDLVTYSQKRNWANGHNNTDGTNDRSWNCGWEGDENVPPTVMALRKKQIKNALSLLLLANGTPMFRMGDEFLQTQGGNNNPYNQDNATSWLDWDRLESHKDVFRFFKSWIAFRKNHPSLSRATFWHGDVHWYGVDGSCDLSPESRAFAYCLRGASEDDVDLYVMFNADCQSKRFHIQEASTARWHRFVDTARSSPDDIAESGQEPPVVDASYEVQDRSIVVLFKE